MMDVSFAFCLAIIWGIIWAGFLQFVHFGQFLVKRRTWLTVVIGVGGDLLIGLMVVPWEWWWPMAAVIMLSSLGIIYRSLHNEASQDDPEKIRLKNKVIWALEEIVAKAIYGREAFNAMKGRLMEKQDCESLMEGMAVLEMLMEIERLAVNARHGEYVGK